MASLGLPPRRLLPSPADLTRSYQICGCFNLEEHPTPPPSTVSPLIRSRVAEETQRLSRLTRCERRRGGRLSETHPQLGVTLVTDFGHAFADVAKGNLLSGERQPSQGSSSCFVLSEKTTKTVIPIRGTCFPFCYLLPRLMKSSA